jgi:hypothetical protein
MKVEISPTSGEEIERLVHDLINTPADVRARVVTAMQPSPEVLLKQ